MERLLDGVGVEELGTLIIDEAGQATPQSALGSIWRTQRAIVVGDPLQVEPIVINPSELRRRFADDGQLAAEYRSSVMSVQSLADAANTFGGYRHYEDEKLWLGCPLIVHRRCLEPMFSISNKIAYNGRMFLQTDKPSADRFIFEKSIWIDIKGKERGNKDHTVPAQMDAVAELMRQSIADIGELPNVFIITPFKSIERSLKQKLRPVLKEAGFSEELVSDWLLKNCGTIHTFQGKEANEVVLVLGCDEDQGRGAAAWVGKVPNIINVAVTRAKYRLAVIGDKALWRRIRYVGTVCEHIDIC